jgi:hypothetical protein
MAFKKAERTKLWARVAIYGPSGSGKSYTALRIGRGLALRCNSRIAAIDTENRSLSKYAGKNQFDFDVEDLGDKTIESYISAINECIKLGHKVLVIDSLSHGWKELLEEVDLIAEKHYGGNNWRAWARGTPKQNKLVNAILNFPGHLIVTMRSKTEWTVGKDKDGKTTITREGLSPEQGKGIEYEFDILMDINQKHIAEIQKDRTGKFQDQLIEKPGEEFGEALFDWLNSGEAEPMPPPSTLRQQCIDRMVDLKGIMQSLHEDGVTKVFTDQEYNTIKAKLETLKQKSDEEKMDIIYQLLKDQTELFHKRYDQNVSKNQPTQKPSVETPKTESEKKSLSDELKKIAGKKGEGEAIETQTVQGTELPEMLNEPENDGFVDDLPDEKVTADAELDIFKEQ